MQYIAVRFIYIYIGNRRKTNLDGSCNQTYNFGDTDGNFQRDGMIQ